MADSPGSADSKVAGTNAAWPIFRSLASYRSRFLINDCVAGLTLAAIAIPEQMATARLGGFDPQLGLFAFLAGALAFVIFGSSRFLSCGADSTIMPIFAGGLALLAVSGSPEYTVFAAALALMVGLILVAGGVFRFGWIADLLSIPVTVGFLAGISAHILVSQLPEVLGLPSPDGPMLQRVAIMTGQLHDANISALCFGFGVLAVIAVSEWIDVRIPGALIGLVAASMGVFLLGLEGRSVSVLGAVSVTLPTPSLPGISIGQWVQLLPLSLIVAAVVMMQTAATTRSFTSDPNEPPDVDRDFIGVGMGSILSAVIGAFPVNASPPRTTIVSETGGRSQISAVVASAIIIALLAFGPSLLRHVPNAALGGVLLFVALRIIRVRQIATIFRQSFGEFLLIVATASAIIVLPIEQGVGIGIALSLLHGIWSTTRARIIIFDRVPGTSIWWPSSPNIEGEKEPNVVVAGFQAPLSFLNAYQFRRDILDALQPSANKTRLLVLEATGIVEIDFTAAQVLNDIIRKCHADGVAFAVARLESIRAQNAMARFGVDEVLGPGNVFRSVEEAIGALGNQAQSKNLTSS